LLIRGGLIADIKLSRRVRFEKQDLRFEGDAVIDLVQNRAPKSEPLQIGRLAVRVSQRKDALALGQAAVNHVRTNEHFLRQLNHFEMAILEYHEQLVEFRAIHLELIAGYFITDVA